MTIKNSNKFSLGIAVALMALAMSTQPLTASADDVVAQNVSGVDITPAPNAYTKTDLAKKYKISRASLYRLVSPYVL